MTFDGWGCNVCLTTQTAKPVFVVLILLFCFNGMWGSIQQFHKGQGPGGVVLWSVLTTFALVGAGRRLFAAGRPPLTLHLTPDGCRLVASRTTFPVIYSGLKPKGWFELIVIGAAVMSDVYATGEWPGAIVWTIVVCVIAQCRRERRQKWRQSLDAAAGRPGYWPAVTSVLPWRLVRRVELRRMRGTHIRIIVTSPLEGQFLSHTLVAVEVPCTPAQADAVATQVDEWAGRPIAVLTAR